MSIAILFGVLALVWPELTLWALVVLWGAFVLADGVFALVTAFAGNVPQGRGWLVFHGLVGIAIGILTFVWPAITGLALLWVIAAWALAVGILQIVNAVRLRREIDTSGRSASRACCRSDWPRSSSSGPAPARSRSRGPLAGSPSSWV